MPKHLNKWLLVALVAVAVGWADAVLSTHDRNAQLHRLSLGEILLEARDSGTDEVLKTSIGPPIQVDGLPLLNIKSPDGLRWKVLFASDVPLTFRISCAGYRDESVRTDSLDTPVVIVRLKKI